MRRFVTTEDIRELAEVGEFELMMREGTVLTDAALDEAHRLGVRLVEGSRLAAPRSPAADGPRPAPPPTPPPGPRTGGHGRRCCAGLAEGDHELWSPFRGTPGPRPHAPQAPY